ncbi:sulfite exporter TauE/SafE family protein [Xylophilus sp.]|uniref:sulfite exporter TauE/SafE family protein n=1 Tax=Xylophilus sp. TaxID=2653893 RepID=UPI0013B8FAED|nr:sulfite exporter TauE/SafE family protein [Xylophilus sp.]KAF1044202.1 MAG: hypothetical protein GAK38_03631 [Xylophilus sp.]
MPELPSAFFLALVAATFALAGFVKGVSGMGLPTVAMGLLGSVMAPAAAAALLVVPSFVTNVWQLAAGPDARGLARRLAPMLAAIAAGTLFGAALLTGARAGASARALGVALVAYAGWALLSPALAVPARWERWLAPAVGFATGLVTGATGVFVIPAVPYLQALRLDKDALVQALGLSFTVSTVALAAGLALHGGLRPAQLGGSALAILPALAGMALGQRLRARIGPRWFRIGFLVLLALLGMELALRG